MLYFTQILFKYIKSISEYSSVFTKFSIGLGLVFILGYFAKIGYFPKDLSLGDGFVFLLITLKFILIYSFFIGTHYFFGKAVYSGIFKIIKFRYRDFFYNLFFKIKRIHLYKFNKIDKNKVTKYIDNFLIGSLKIIFFPFSALIIWGFYQHIDIEKIYIILLNIMMVVLFIDIFNNHLKGLRKEKIIIINVSQLSNELKTDEKKIMTIFLVILLVPALMYFTALDNDKNFLMKLTFNSLRVEGNTSSVYLKKEYKDLLPEDKFEIKMENYYKLKNINIPLRGIGKNALITYRSDDNKYIFKVEIPNDALQVESKEGIQQQVR